MQPYRRLGRHLVRAVNLHGLCAVIAIVIVVVIYNEHMVLLDRFQVKTSLQILTLQRETDKVMMCADGQAQSYEYEILWSF